MTNIYIIALLFALPMTQPKSTLIYIGDPMCSWCYGITDELSGVKEKFDDFDFELIMGGLRPYNTQMMSELKDFLEHHWEEVNQASGQEFKYDILDDTKITYDTEPPCRANVVVRQLAPEKAFAFFKGTQRAFYFHNKNMHLKESYHDILKELEIDTQRFDDLFESDKMKELVRGDFEQSAEWGISGFPALILQYRGKLTLVANGYSTKEDIILRIETVIKKSEGSTEKN